MMAIELKDGTHLESAHNINYAGMDRSPVQSYDDCMGPLWLFGHEFGVAMVIRAQSFESAWEIAIDESPVIPDTLSDICEAYGYYGPECRNDAGELWEDAVRAAENCENFPELIEGYEYQSNATGSGIVDVGHYAWLREALTSDFLGDSRLRIVVRAT